MRPSEGANMRDAATVHVDRAILHVLDHRKGEGGPVYSDIELDLEASSEVREYFEEQIDNTRADGATADARFLSRDAGSAAEACRAILDDPSQLVARSQGLARQLAAATASDGRISPGTLAVCLFHTETPAAGPFLALLKIDLTTVPIVRLGKRSVTLRMADDALPSPRQKLQKAALVARRGYDKGFDLLLLDRQVPEVAAQFFARTFLAAEWAASPKELTQGFYVGAAKALKDLTGPASRRPGGVHLEPAEAELVHGAVSTALDQAQIDTGRVIRDLRIPKAAKQVLLEELDERLGVREFPVDRGTADRRTKKVRFRGDYGVVFEVERAFKDEVVEIVGERTAPNGATITEVRLRVPNLQWLG